MKSVRITTSAATLAVVLVLAGCGSDDDTTDPAATSSPSRDASATPPAGGGFDEAQLKEIRECLEAAGLDDAFPTDLPSGAPSALPSDFDPENLPEGFPSEGAGGPFSALQDPEVQDALDACGIELPQRPTNPPS